MNVMELLAMGVTALFFLVGLLGAALPILPGTLIVWVGIVIHRLWMGPESVSWTFVAVGLGAVALSYLIDFIFTYWGAKRFGASWQGALGSVLGGIVGLFFGLAGIIIGPIIGAVLFEWIKVRAHKQALRAGVGTIVGGLLGMVAKVFLTAGLIAAFFVYLPYDPR